MRKIAVTGASSGVGRGFLEMCLKQGWTVAAVCRSAPNTWEEPALSPNLLFLETDLRDDSQVLEHAKLLAAWGVDTLVHCACSYGIGARHTFLDTGLGEWDDILATNLRGQVGLNLALLPHLITMPRALILAVSSEVATTSAPGRIAYGASKAAAHQLYAGLAEELKSSSVRVRQVLPTGQIRSRGLAARRPVDFDFKGYRSGGEFAEQFRDLVTKFGEGFDLVTEA